MATILSRSEGAWRSFRPVQSVQSHLHHRQPSSPPAPLLHHWPNTADTAFELAPGRHVRCASTLSGNPRTGPRPVSGHPISPVSQLGDVPEQNDEQLWKALDLVRDIFRQGGNLLDWNFSSPSYTTTQAADGHDTEAHLSQLPQTFQAFFKNLRLGDVRTALVEAQKDGIFLDPEPWISMSQTSFSAITRSLDPFKIGPQVDPAHGINIPPGAMYHSALTDIVEPSSVRRVYAFLFRIFQWLFAVRIASGTLPTRSDWKYLMRLAGTTGDRMVARRVWSASAWVQKGSGVDSRNSENYAEFIRSRFQTVPLYYHFNIAKSRVSIFDIGFKSNLKFSRSLRRLLYAIRVRKALRARRRNPGVTIEEVIGSGDMAYGSEWFHDLFLCISDRGVVASEDLICSSIAAFARMGSFPMVRRLLASVWDIRIHVDKETRNVTISGGRFFPDGHPLFPTKRLMDTVILAFGSNSEIQTAIKLADFISNLYDIPISPDVWTAMLSWTYIAASKQVSSEWKAAGFPDKLVDPEAIQMVWDTMISAPYKIEPSLSDYDIFIRFLLSKGRIQEAVRHICKARDQHWKKQVKEFHDAELAYIIALQTRRGTGREALRYERALVHRSIMHWRIGSWISRLTARVRSEDDNDDYVVRVIPNMMRDFKEFIQFPLTYETCNGLVSLREEVRTPSATAVKPRNAEGIDLEEALRWNPPSNFSSRRWFRDLLDFRAQHLGLGYRGAAYGPMRLGLGRPVLRRSRLRGRMVVMKRQANERGQYQSVRRTISNSWRTVDLHYSSPRPKQDTKPYKLNVPRFHLRMPPAPRIFPGLDGQLKADSLVLSPRPAQVIRDSPALVTLSSVFSGLVHRGRLSKVPKEKLTKWEDLRFDFIHGLHPGIRDQDAWEYSMKAWPDIAGIRQEKLARARKVRLFLDGKRVTRDDLKEFPVIEKVVPTVSGRRILVKKHGIRRDTALKDQEKRESDFFRREWQEQAAKEEHAHAAKSA